MARRPSFAETLDEAIGAAQDDTQPAAQAERFVYLPQSAAPFVFVYSRQDGTPGVSGAPAAGPSPAGVRHAYGRPDTAARAATMAAAAATAVAEPTGLLRAMTSRQQRGFEAMNALGGGLLGDFEVADLRRAFRRLAREYHPDAHPGCTPVELVHLTRTFAELSSHYRCLLALFDAAE